MLPIFLVYSCYFTISMAYYFPIHHQIWLTETSVTSNSLYFKLPEWSTVIHLLNIQLFALTSVAQLTGRHSAKKRLLLQFLASGLGSRLGCAQDTTNRCLSLSFSLPSLSLKINILVVAGVAQWTECQPANRRVAGWFPVRAHACGAGQVPSWGNERQPIDVSLVHISVSLPPPAK